MARNKKKLVDSFAALVHSPKIRRADLPSPTPSQVFIDDRIIDMPMWHLGNRPGSHDASLADTVILNNDIETEKPTIKKRKRGTSPQVKEGESSGPTATVVKRRTMKGMGTFVDDMDDDLERKQQELLAQQVAFEAQRLAFEEARAAFEMSKARLTEEINEIAEDRAHLQGSIDRIGKRWMGPAKKHD